MREKGHIMNKPEKKMRQRNFGLDLNDPIERKIDEFLKKNPIRHTIITAMAKYMDEIEEKELLHAQMKKEFLERRSSPSSNSPIDDDLIDLPY